MRFWAPQARAHEAPRAPRPPGPLLCGAFVKPDRAAVTLNAGFPTLFASLAPQRSGKGTGPPLG